MKADKEAASDEKSDAYSFATLLREIIWYGVKTGRRYAGLSSQQKENIHKVIQRGIHSNSATRASMQEILDVFKDVRHERKQTPHSGLEHQDDHKRQD